MAEEWEVIERPGYFGRRRDEKLAEFDKKYGAGNWRIAWDTAGYSGCLLGYLDFLAACRYCYERSYFEYLKDRKDDLDFICSHGECIDNAPTNVECGLDYSKQEAFSTHIQDIAVRNVLYLLGRKFEGPADKILVIRSEDSNGYRFGPGNVPYIQSSAIRTPSKCPKWANKGSVEDFWQSNKYILAKKK